nr:14134_t:CDS:2 [Entrophospora candida]
MWIKSCIKPFLKQSLFNNKNIIIDNNTTNKLFTFTTIINNNIRFLSTLRTESINNDKFTTSNNVLIPENNYIIRPRAVSPLPSHIEAWVYSFETNLPLEILKIDRKVFGAPIRKDILHRVVVWQRDNMRQGTHSAKTRAEVSGTGKKFAPQKGRGRARVGSHRAPHIRGGGVVHPPKPRDHGTLLQRNVRELGVRSALSTKYAQNQFIIVDKIKLKTHKTKDLLSILEKNAWDPFGKNQTEGNDAQQRINRVEGHSILFLTREHKKELDLASRNLQKVHALTANEIFEMSDVYNILGHEVLIIEKDAIQDFENLLRPL